MGLDGRTTLNEAFTVTRTIPIVAAASGHVERVIESLENLEPVAYARVTGSDRLQVRYDASCFGFRELEHLLDDAGIVRPFGLWWRLRAAWYAFVDQNARSNARSGGGACCNRPPGLGGGNGP